LAVDALETARANRAVIADGLVHHSDRGVQYTCSDDIARIETAGIQPSMSRAGCPYDDAMAENFIKTLTHVEVDARAYRDLAHTSAAIGEFIETTYNRQRLHATQRPVGLT
jgi:putative transposase